MTDYSHTAGKCSFASDLYVAFTSCDAQLGVEPSDSESITASVRIRQGALSILQFHMEVSSRL